MAAFAQPRRRFHSVNYLRPDGSAVTLTQTGPADRIAIQRQDYRAAGACPVCQRFDGCEHTYVPATEIAAVKWSGLRTAAFFVGACTAFWSTALSVLADERHQAPFIVLILAGAVVAFWAAGRP